MTCTLQYYASRKGAPILGKLQYSGNGPRKEFRPHDSIDSLRDSCDRANNRLLKRSTEDRHSVTLLEKTQGDATLGRMSWPYQPDDLRGVVVNSRFGVEQGVTDKGTPKVRPVDDFSASGVNKCCEPTERLQHDGVDSLFQLTKLFREKVGVVPSLFKADIDAASHRVPLDPAHRWAATIAFRVKGRWACAEHWAVPFGAIGSVFAWDRVGALLAHIGRKLLRLPLLRSASVNKKKSVLNVCHRYVDDYFGCLQPECVDHGMHCFARLVSLLLGDGAVSPHKLVCGMPLCILGLDVTLCSKGVLPQCDRAHVLA